MKTAKLLLLSMLLFTGAFAQGTYITIGASIEDSQGNPIPNHLVTVVDSTNNLMNPVTTTTYFTDANGMFIDSLFTGVAGVIYILTSDSCQNYSLDTVYSGNTQTLIWMPTITLACTTGPSTCNFNLSAAPLFPGNPSQQGNYSFTSTYQGSGASNYNWSFGDGSSGTGANPYHQYQQVGTYVYCLTVDNCPVVCDTLVVTSISNCSYQVYNKPDPFTSTYTYNFGNTHLGNPNSQYTWHFGDGDSSNAFAPTHTYAQTGTYYYSLKVDSCAPVIDTLVVYPRKQVNISGYVKDANNMAVANQPYAYAVEYTVGNTSYYNYYGPQNMPSLITDVNGYYSHTIYQILYSGITNNKIHASVWDTCAQAQVTGIIHAIQPNTNMVSFNDTITISCNGTAANCNYSVNATYVPGTNTALFTSTHQNNPLNPSVYTWSFGDGNMSSLETPLHVYTQPGTYIYCLQVDSCPPVCDTIMIGQGSGCDPFFLPLVVGNTVEIYPSMLSGQFQAIVDWGDGVLDTFTSQNIPVLPNTISHTYAASGNYQICLTHSNAQLGCSNTHCEPVSIGTVSPIQCNTEFVVDTVNSQPGQVVLWNTSSVSGASPAAAVNFLWDFGDGTTSTLAYPTHTYQNPGTYVVCVGLTIIDSTALGLLTCIDYHCDTLVVDQNGNLIYKGAIMGWSLNVLNPNTVGVDEDALSDIVVYPNPASDFLKLSNPNAIDIAYQLINTNGQLIRSGVAQNTETTIEMMDLASGIYILQVQVEQNQKQFKIVKW